MCITIDWTFTLVFSLSCFLPYNPYPWRAGVTNKLVLDSLLLYPVKSCAAMKVWPCSFISFRGTKSVMACIFLVCSLPVGFTFFQMDSWLVGNRGLRWDREWAVLSEKGSCLSQKQEPLMAAIVPAVDCRTGQLTLCRRKQERGGNDKGAVVVSAGGATYAMPSHHSLCQARVCGDRSVNVKMDFVRFTHPFRPVHIWSHSRVQGWDCGQEASTWLSSVLGRKCRLVKMAPDYKREAKSQPSMWCVHCTRS